ncbi:ATP-dependent DNA helicase pif1-like [Leptopilina boulardi]|uniref:ATP-dependent DNA helicase pif1-like n=1 Tax=Leptopilina boulardi TaxID=63433 RepID=UPI0021F5EA61|nr:ATP-dependent DNA helicase pif1-like [Leptopilina boulardi]
MPASGSEGVIQKPWSLQPHLSFLDDSKAEDTRFTTSNVPPLPRRRQVQDVVEDSSQEFFSCDEDGEASSSKENKENFGFTVKRNPAKKQKQDEPDWLEEAILELSTAKITPKAWKERKLLTSEELRVMWLAKEVSNFPNKKDRIEIQKHITTFILDKRLEDDSENDNIFEDNDEVLIIDRNKLISNDIINIAPGQDKLPLRIFISGSTGVGKSKTIDAIYQSVSNYLTKNKVLNPDSAKVLLCAPSGKAAFLINGVTLHTAFALPITQFGGKVQELSSNVANTLREKMNDVELLIIDEVSMVGSTTLNRVDVRLRQIKGINDSFGGISVILVGDLHQLPPVMDRPIYSTPNTSDLCILANNPLWEEFKIFELTEIMRQKEDRTFIESLNNLANGTISTNDISLFSLRIFNESDVPKQAIRLFAENKYVNI